MKKQTLKPKASFKYLPEKTKIHIVETGISSYKKNIDEFIRAVNAARNKQFQERSLIYDMYSDVLTIDDVVSSFIDKRIENIHNKRIVVERNEKPYDDIKYFIEAPSFKMFLKDILMTKFWGFNLFEFGVKLEESKLWFDYSTINHKHVNPYRMEVLHRQHDQTGTKFEKLPNFMFLGDKNNLGYLVKITLLSLYGRRGMFNYSRYTDLAGENFTQLIERDFSDDYHIDEIQNNLNKEGQGGNLSLPEGIEVSTENSSTSQQNDLFEGYMDQIRQRLSVLILGQTMTTEDGSSRSQAEVHQSEQDKKYQSDLEYVQDALNYFFVEYLHLWGFENQGVRFKLVPTTQDEIRIKLNNYEKLRNLGITFTDEELRETFKDII